MKRVADSRVVGLVIEIFGWFADDMRLYQAVGHQLVDAIVRFQAESGDGVESHSYTFALAAAAR